MVDLGREAYLGTLEWVLRWEFEGELEAALCVRGVGGTGDGGLPVVDVGLGGGDGDAREGLLGEVGELLRGRGGCESGRWGGQGVRVSGSLADEVVVQPSTDLCDAL